MYDWQVVIAAELFVVVVGWALLLLASNLGRGPRLFAQIFAVIVIILASLLVGYTGVATVVDALKAKPKVASQPAVIVVEKPAPPPKPVVAVGPAAAPTAAKPVSEWEGDLIKRKKKEEGDMLKRKWAER